MPSVDELQPDAPDAPDTGQQPPSEPVFVSPWAAINGMIRDRMQQTDEVVPDALLDPIVGAFCGWLVAQYPCITSYSALAGADKTAFDYALALIVAVHARPWLPKASSTGELYNYTHGTTRFAYRNVSGTAQKSTNVVGQLVQNIEHQWLDEAWQMLRQVSCIAARVAATKASFHIYAQAGRRRRQQAAGYPSLAASPLFDLHIDDLFAWMDVWKAV